MKKILVAVLFTMALTIPIGVRGQYADWYYHRVGDTVDWDTHIGYYSWWEWEYYYENNLIVLPTIYEKDYYLYEEATFDSAIALQYFYTPVPLKVIGIAGTCFRGMGYTYMHNPDTNGIEEYLYIYDAGPGDNFTQVSATRWNPFDPKRYIRIPYQYCGPGPDTDSCCHFFPREEIIPISEYYFDTAIWITDSFYVGGSLFGRIWDYQTTEQFYTGYGEATLFGMIPCDEQQVVVDGSCVFPSIVTKKKAWVDPAHWGTPPPFDSLPWQYDPRVVGSLIIYPIIEVDTTVPPEGSCQPVANVEATVSGTTATITWDDFPNYTAVTLRYGFINQPADTWTAIDVTGSSLYTLHDLEPTIRYGVSLQAYCKKDEMPWSEDVYFMTGIDTTTSINPTTLLAAQTFVQPNPARDRVRVSSSFGLKQIEIHDVTGMLVYSERATGHDVWVDVGILRPGSYIVTIQTHNGTTHKRLIVV